MSHTIPLLGHEASQVAAYRRGRPVSAAQLLRDIARLADRLPRASHVLNACADRYAFAVALGAALVRKQVSVLPPDVLPQTLRELQNAYPGLYAISDDATLPGIRCVAAEESSTRSAADAINPELPADQLAAVVFTSGSTGKPHADAKSWGHLAHGAASAAARLGLHAPAALVATVPPQHMYGLESSVLIALRNGHALHAARPFYPADVQASLAEIPGERVLLTTPVHLRALLEADLDLPPMRLAVCATAALPLEWARRFEARYGTPLQEVYGFSEAGMVATRRTVNDEPWRALPDVRLEARGGQVWAGGGHIARPVPCPDAIELRGDGRFILLGRGSDLVNVAGKRTSLAHLNRQLNAIAGVRDGVFVLPEDRPGELARPMAFVVAPGMTREAVLEALRDRIDAVFLPRPLHLVDALPRNAVGKLPRAAVLDLAPTDSPSGGWQDEIRVPDDHPSFAGHFPGDPVVPGAVLLDQVIEAVTRALGRTAGPLDVIGAKFLRPVRPGDALRLRFSPAADNTVRFECVSEDQPAVSGVLRFDA